MPSISSMLVLVVFAFAGLVAPAQDSVPPESRSFQASLDRLPLYFVENQGVYPDAVKYYVAGKDKTLFSTPAGIVFRLKGKDRDWVVKLVFVEANPDVVPAGENRQSAVFSYFKGPEKNWKTGLATFSKVVYRDLWPGIDLIYRGTVNQLKYEFVVAPGADPTKIRLRYEGATAVKTDECGALQVETPVGGFEDAPPVGEARCGDCGLEEAEEGVGGGAAECVV